MFLYQQLFTHSKVILAHPSGKNPVRAWDWIQCQLPWSPTDRNNFILLCFFEGKFLDKGDKELDIEVHKTSLFQKFSAVKHNFVIHKEGGDRKRRKVGWCLRCTCRSASPGCISLGLIKLIVLWAGSELRSWKMLSLIYHIPAWRTMACILIEAATFVWKTYHSPVFFNLTLLWQKRLAYV